MLESKSTFSQRRGRLCEQWALEYYQKKAYKLVGRNLKFPYAEVDLLLERQARLILVEVKSSQHCAFRGARVGRRQLQRLSQCLQWLCSETRGPVEAHLALVKGPGEVEIIEDFLAGFLAKPW